MAKPYADGGFTCPTCGVLHPVKAVHLWLNDAGECLVSEGVLEELRMAGMPDLVVVGAVDNPPTLQIGDGVNRAAVDQNNRQITQYIGAQDG
jgi:hypothetical protein